MIRLRLLLPILLISISSAGQFQIKHKLYPSLLWEITGNGLKKPSYLFGTMHVSSKIAFHLSDSFYLGLRTADVVALETNPESWQEDMSQYDFSGYGYDYGRSYRDMNEDVPNDYITLSTLKFPKYEKLLEAALFSEPSVINNLLYRSYSNRSSDFEEDTYLDMYIYQLGKKLGKRVAGVENYGESMRLMMEAYRDAARDRTQKQKSYDDIDLSPMRLQEAYRTGNLDLLDSINRMSSYSEAFDEKFLFRRNEIQADNIDSILKRSSLFVGVGAAHLPGNRGVIEILRRKGYKLRPIMMGMRDSKHKDMVEKIRVPVVFNTQSSPDGFFKVDIPGKFYDFREYGPVNQCQYADMANGSYYIVTRVRTNGLFWGHGPNIITKKIDSVLYENVPGKILSKKTITKNGYAGYDITNRTRRGDYQRYNIFITPFEVLFFKMSGNSDYVRDGVEAKRFFESIHLKETPVSSWQKYQPAYGGFSAEFPHHPYEVFGDGVQYEALDKQTNTNFAVIRTEVHNHHFAEEDTFDLSLMEESYGASEFIDKKTSRVLHKVAGYPALDAKYKHNDGSFSFVRFLIQGTHYYTIIAHGNKENESMRRFINSFTPTPLIYAEKKDHSDSIMGFTVSTTWFPEEKKTKLDIPMLNSSDDDDLYPPLSDQFRTRIITNDTTGERILVTFLRSADYYYSNDSTRIEKFTNRMYDETDSTWIERQRKYSMLPGNLKVLDVALSDTNSSRLLRIKMFYAKGIIHVLSTQTDTLTDPSSFVSTFFETFRPADTLNAVDPYVKKNKKFFNDLFSSDSVTRKKAVRSAYQVRLDSTDLGSLKKAIESFNWNDKKYLDTKKTFISKLDEIKTRQSADYLQKLYYQAGDTVELQYTILETLLRHSDQYSYSLFSDIITSDPPVLSVSDDDRYSPEYYYRGGSGYGGINFMDYLYDSLKLTALILPDLLPLMNIDDYKWPVMRLLGSMLDSGLVTRKTYEQYFTKFLIEAKQELKKQSISEKKKLIEEAEEERSMQPSTRYYDRNSDDGNADLSMYATLLLPFIDSDQSVQQLFQQLLRSNDKRIRYNTMLLLLKQNKSVPDTLIAHFAALDEFRYELYNDLAMLGKLSAFPSRYNDHLSLGRSMLISSRDYKAPDSIQFIERVTLDHKNRSGYVYFFRYKEKKDDVSWKLATVGLLPIDTTRFLFDAIKKQGYVGEEYENKMDPYDFTSYSVVKIKDEEPLKEQMSDLLRRLIFSKRKSAKLFYNESSNRQYDQTMMIED